MGVAGKRGLCGSLTGVCLYCPSATVAAALFVHPVCLTRRDKAAALKMQGLWFVDSDQGEGVLSSSPSQVFEE